MGEIALENISINLYDVPMETDCVIEKVEVEQGKRIRLLDLGFYEGSRVKPLYLSAGGGTTAFFVKGTLIALRKEDSGKIFATPYCMEAMEDE